MAIVAKNDKYSKQLARWRKPGSEGFFNWIDDVKPMIPSEKGGFTPYTIPSELVREELRRALDGNYSTVVLCWPRRHGKTVVSALLIVWRFMTRPTQTIAIVANSATQTIDTAFRLVRTILTHTPMMKELVDAGHVVIQSDTIRYDALGSSIQGFASSAASLYGKKLSVAQVSEYHAARNDEIYQTLASSTIDTADGLVLLDSTVGARTSPLYGLYNLAQNGGDESLYYSHIHYADLDDAIRRGPPWISERKLRSRAAQMLPAEFAAMHLNQWGSSSNRLFTDETIAACRKTYPLDVEALADGRAYVVGGGLDRALIFSKHGDATVAAAVMKVVSDNSDEPEFYVLACDKLTFSTEAAVKRKFTAFAREFGMKHAAFERYEAQDLALWSQGQGIETELIHATPKQQGVVFTALATAAQEGRLHVAPKFEALLGEMVTFEYALAASGHDGTTVRFEHAKGAHDDHIYALAWAIYSLREEELNPYQMSGIHCHASGSIARACILNDGSVIPNCSDECRSFCNVKQLYERYKTKSGAATMEIDDFFRYRVTNVGSHTVSR